MGCLFHAKKKVAPELAPVVKNKMKTEKKRKKTIESERKKK